MYFQTEGVPAKVQLVCQEMFTFVTLEDKRMIYHLIVKMLLCTNWCNISYAHSVCLKI